MPSNDQIFILSVLCPIWGIKQYTTSNANTSFNLKFLHLWDKGAIRTSNAYTPGTTPQSNAAAATGLPSTFLALLLSQLPKTQKSYTWCRKINALSCNDAIMLHVPVAQPLVSSLLTGMNFVDRRTAPLWWRSLKSKSQKGKTFLTRFARSAYRSKFSLRKLKLDFSNRNKRK